MLNLVKKILALFYLVVILQPISVCAFNPCNEIHFGFWTYTFPDHKETWNGTNYSRRESPLCPPWNKTARSGCLKQFPLAAEYDMTYNRYCAEKSDRTDFFRPKIKVRVQTCNLACWTLSKHLDGDGECTIFPGPFGIPTTRLCARVASPAEPALKSSPLFHGDEGIWPVSQNPPPAEDPGKPADHGYVYAWHLGNEGQPLGDPIYPGDDGTLVYHARPKVCAYWDPSFWDSLANYATYLFGGAMLQASALMGIANNAGVVAPDAVNEFIRAAGVDPASAQLESANLGDMLQANLQPDLWDLNPVHQAIHYHEGGVFIVFKLIIQMIKMRVQMQEMMNKMLDALPDGLKYTILIMQGMIYVMNALFVIGADIMIPVLEYLGQFNNVVAAGIGCTMIPLGPYPPPYCDTLILPDPAPMLTRICHTTVHGTEVPDGVNKCVNSNIENNAIRNSVRVGFRDMMPLCESGQSPSDMCVEIHPTRNPQTLYTMTNGRSIINVCDATQSNLPCVESPRLTEKCAEDTEWCKQGIRIEYSLSSNGSGNVIPLLKDFYNTTIPSCGLLTDAPVCQNVWGVNIGYWRDVSLVFPDQEAGYNISDLISSTQTITSPAGSDVSFRLLIPRINRIMPGGAELDSDRIYLFNDALDRVLDSLERPEAPKPTVYNCGSQGVNCTSHHIRPGIVVKIQVNSDSTKGALSTETAIEPRPLNTLVNSKLNLAGREFGSFVTDDDYTIMPFEGTNALTPNTLVGNYKNGIPTYSSTGAITPANLIHTGGLDYYLGKYALGGSKICLSGYDFDDCFSSESKLHCVLTNLSNADQVRCTDFVNMLYPRYSGLGLCTADQVTNYSNIEIVDVPKPLGGTLAITVMGDTANGPYCYDYAGRETLGKLCIPSQKREDRVTPDPIFGDVLSETSCAVTPPSLPPCNYDFDPVNPPNANSLGVRNKNAVEHNMCVDVPDGPSCAAVTEAGVNWPTSASIREATGVCLGGGAQKGPDSLKRYCTIDRNTGQTMWEPVTADMGCKEVCYIMSDFAKTRYDAGAKKLILEEPKLATGIYERSIKFNISNINAITKYKLSYTGADDSIKFEVNDTEVAAASAKGDIYIPNEEFNALTWSSKKNIDLKSYLNEGSNKIKTTTSVSGGGRSKTVLDIDIPDCPDFTISRHCVFHENTEIAIDDGPYQPISSYTGSFVKLSEDATWTNMHIFGDSLPANLSSNIKIKTKVYYMPDPDTVNTDFRFALAAWHRMDDKLTYPKLYLNGDQVINITNDHAHITSGAGDYAGIPVDNYGMIWGWAGSRHEKLNLRPGINEIILQRNKNTGAIPTNYTNYTGMILYFKCH